MTQTPENDPFNLERFASAQEESIESVLAELKGCRKTGHWMWYVFPQAHGLGSSPRAVRYAIGSFEEAKAYLDHGILGPRLRECTRRVIDCDASEAESIFGVTDTLKFRSCMTLFDAASETGDNLFARALARFFDGEGDGRTYDLLSIDR